MQVRTRIWIAAGAVALAAGGYLAYREYSGTAAIPAVEMVSALPPDATTVVYADLAALRQSPLLASLRAFAPAAPTEREYADFVRDSGFDFERDLDRAAIALTEGGSARTAYALADGRFDANKIETLALKGGVRRRQGGREVFATKVAGDAGTVTFSFVAKSRIALTNGPDLGPMLVPSHGSRAHDELAERARQLAGSPVFFILRPSRKMIAWLAAELPGGIRSDRLAELLEQLQWITIAVRADGERTKVVLEGESLSEDVARQISSALETLQLAAAVALGDPKVRARMDSAEYAGLRDLVKTAEITRLDRGGTKAVRLILSAGPELATALLRRPAPEPPGAPTEAPAKKGGGHKKGKG